jgi:hypothetical protein
VTTPGLVSTIVPVHNRPTLLRKAVESVLAQTYRPIEVVVVDDGSTDDTPEAAARLADRHPEVTVIRQANQGAGAARETGRRQARGEFIQYLDSDDELLPLKFEIQVDALVDRSECGIAYGITRLVDERGCVVEPIHKWTGTAFERLLPALLVDRWWNTHTPLYRRSVCDAVGPWASLPISEDWEYEARVAALGVRLVWCPQPLSDTRRHTSARLTDMGLTPELLRAVVRVQRALWAAAVATCCDPRSVELRHFSRWAFSVARQAGRLGLEHEARASLLVAAAAARAHLRDRGEVAVYRGLVALAGPRLPGRVAAIIDGLRNRPGGARTLRLARQGPPPS